LKPIDKREVEVGLAARIATDAARRFGLDGLPQLSAAWRIVNPYSIVLCLEYRRKDWRQRFFAKLALHAQVSRDELRAQLQVEFDVLHKLHPLADRARSIGTVEPLALYLEIPSLVTVEAQGVTLRKAYARQGRLWSTVRARVSLVELAEQCGQWLADFHDQNIRFNKLKTSFPGLLTPAQIETICRAAHRLGEQMPAGAVRICGRHNDFASHNIIAGDEGGLSVLDFMSFDHGPEAFDACNFWFELELLKFDRSYSPSLLAQMQQAFLTGYGRIDPERPDFRLARLRYSINRLLNELAAARGLDRWSPRRRSCVSGTKAWLLAFGSEESDARSTRTTS
jgi:hypothetical protein